MRSYARKKWQHFKQQSPNVTRMRTTLIRWRVFSGGTHFPIGVRHSTESILMLNYLFNRIYS